MKRIRKVEQADSSWHTEKSDRELLIQINQKLDILLSKLGVHLNLEGGQPIAKTPSQVRDEIEVFIENSRKRRALRTMKLIDHNTGKMRCHICGSEHLESEFKPKSFKKYHCKNGCSLPKEALPF